VRTLVRLYRRLPGYNTADYYSPATGTTIVAWINYQAKEPVECVASVMVRDIARIITPDHVPFVYKRVRNPPNPDRSKSKGPLCARSDILLLSYFPCVSAAKELITVVEVVEAEDYLDIPS
jgi:hypothetical protein